MGNALAKLYLGNAVGFHLAAKRIADAGTGIDFPWPPFFATAGYAIELSLKAYILQRGGTERDCRNVGHDLQAAMRKACEHGLQQPCKEITTLLAKIGPYHRHSNFRYMKPVDVSTLPSVVQTLNVTQKHIEKVANQLPELLPIATESSPNSCAGIRL